MPDQVRIVHAADIHLDSPLRGLGRLGREDVVAHLRGATRQAFDALVAYCVETTPDALVLAGDLYDGDWTDYTTGMHFNERMYDLRDAGVPVVVVRGNHDAASVITRSLPRPDNVLEFRTSEPETFTVGGVAFHGQSFARQAEDNNLALGYPDAIPGLVNVGVLHTSVAGYEGHDPYAPCTLEHLASRGYEYFALGHIHKREQWEIDGTTIAFSGNLQGRKPSEVGAKGALEVLLTPGAPARASFLPFDVARWDVLQVDVEGSADEDEIFARVERRLSEASRDADGRPLVVRVALTGVHDLAGSLADREQLESAVRPMAVRRDIVVDKVRSEVTAPVAARRMPATQRAQLQEVVDSLLADPRAARLDPALKKDIEALTSEVNRQYTKPVGLDLASDDQWAQLVADAAQRLLARADGGLL